jgi:hypothetical protein
MKILILCIIVFVILWSIWGHFASRAEKAVYTVIEEKDGYEIRQYAAHIIAQTTVSTSDYNEGMNSGFRIIASYIFGANTKRESIAMTTPVITQEASSSSEKIAMTTPVLTKNEDAGRTMSFVMPSGYTIDTLPTPTDSRVKLIEVPLEKKVALRFSWFRTESRIEKNKIKLQSMLERDGINIDGPLEFAGYNGPGTPPWMTRHEILVRVK